MCNVVHGMNLDSEGGGKTKEVDSYYCPECPISNLTFCECIFLLELSVKGRINTLESEDKTKCQKEKELTIYTHHSYLELMKWCIE